MSKPSGNSGREKLAEILRTAVQQDGPVRLFQPHKPRNRKGIVGLFRSSNQLQKQITGTLLDEIPSGSPRMVRLNEAGLERLLQNTHQAKRSTLVKSASPLYRDELLETWKRIATRGESNDLNQCIDFLFGKWSGGGSSSSGSGNQLDEFRELFAQEIANSWNEADSTEAKNRLAHLLKLLGAQPLGKKDETVDFTGLHHLPLEPLFKGDPAKVVTPGWTFPRDPSPLLLVKAAVKPAG